jgi:hypothetical protein
MSPPLNLYINPNIPPQPIHTIFISPFVHPGNQLAHPFIYVFFRLDFKIKFYKTIDLFVMLIFKGAFRVIKVVIHERTQ